MSKKPKNVNLRRNATPRITRAIPAPEDMSVRTIFGTNELKTKRCSCCHETKLISDFYFRAKSLQKPGNTHERICCLCWNKQVKARRKGKEPEAITIIRDLL